MWRKRPNSTSHLFGGRADEVGDEDSIFLDEFFAKLGLI